MTKRPKPRVRQTPERFDFAMADPAHARRVMDDLAIGPYPLPVATGDMKEARRLDSLALTVRRLDSLVQRGWVANVVTQLPAESAVHQYVLTDEGKQALARWKDIPQGDAHGGH